MVGRGENLAKVDRLIHQNGLPAEVTRFEAVSEADTLERLVTSVDTAAEYFGFQFAQVMVVAVTPKPAAFVLKSASDKLLSFDRAVIASSDLASAYDHDVGDPALDPVMLKLRRTSAPVVWDGDTYISSGAGQVRDWCIENDRGCGVTAKVMLPVTESGTSMAVLFSVQRRDPIRAEAQARTAADVALLAMHAAVGSENVLVPFLVAARRSDSPLTPTMRQYLFWAERGKTAGETAVIVGRKYSTVKNVIAQSIERLGCTKKTDAIKIARASGWL